MENSRGKQFTCLQLHMILRMLKSYVTLLCPTRMGLGPLHEQCSSIPTHTCSWLLRSLNGCHSIYECLCSDKSCYLMSTPKHKNSDVGHVDKTKKGHGVFHLKKKKKRKVLNVRTEKSHLLVLRSSRKKQAISLWGSHKEGKRNVC